MFPKGHSSPEKCLRSCHLTFARAVPSACVTLPLYFTEVPPALQRVAQWHVPFLCSLAWPCPGFPASAGPATGAFTPHRRRALSSTCLCPRHRHAPSAGPTSSPSPSSPWPLPCRVREGGVTHLSPHQSAPRTSREGFQMQIKCVCFKLSPYSGLVEARAVS